MCSLSGVYLTGNGTLWTVYESPSKKWPFFISSYQGKIMLPPIVHFYVGNEDMLYNYGTRYKFMDIFIQENYNTPRYRTPVRQSPWPTMKGIPSKRLLVKVARGVFHFGVLKQP